jgi:peptide/nickel transport system substrate-binding protein
VEFWRDGWIADYPDPENFLKLFHGKLVPEDSVKASYLNTVRFTNDEFDRYFEGAMHEPVKADRTALFLKADQEIIKNAAVIPLYYEKWIWLSSERVQNLVAGPMGELDLTKVYFSSN